MLPPGGDGRAPKDVPDPGALELWQRLRQDLLAMRDMRPLPFLTIPSPDGGFRRPPVRIHLTAVAVELAERLHARYGDFVALRVGALPYPPGAVDPRQPPRDPEPDRPTADPAELDCALDGPLSVRTGETVTHGLLLTNRGRRPVTVNTDGDVAGRVVDPTTSEVIGGFVGPHTQPLVMFTAEPGETVRVPLLVGTASFTSRLGYAVPPGEWHLVAPLDLGDGRRLLTPALDLTVTA